MPLQSSYDAPTGDSYAAAHHVVTEALLEVAFHRMRATVSTWRDAAAFAQGLLPVATRNYVWGPEEYAASPGIQSALADLEGALLALPDFAGATIVP